MNLTIFFIILLLIIYIILAKMMEIEIPKIINFHKIKWEKEHKYYKIKKLYIVANDILDNSAKKFIKENNDILDYKIIPYINN